MRELDNLRSAVAWSFDRDDTHDHDLALRIVAALASEANSGRTLEVGVWAERVLPLLERSTPERRAAVLSAASWNAILGGDLDLGCDRANAVLREPRPGFAQTSAYVQLAYVESIKGHYDSALATLEEGLAALDASPPADEHLLALMKALLVTGYSGMELVGTADSPEPGSTRASEALHLAQASGHPTSLANALFVSVLDGWRTDSPHAEAMLDESITLVRGGVNSVMYPVMLSIKALVRAKCRRRQRSVRGVPRSDHAGQRQGRLAGPRVCARLQRPGAGDPRGTRDGGHNLRRARRLAPNARHQSRVRDPHREQALETARRALGDVGYEAALARVAPCRSTSWFRTRSPSWSASPTRPSSVMRPPRAS